MAKRQPKSNKTEEATEVAPGVFTDEADDRGVAEPLDESEEVAEEDQEADDQNNEDDEPRR